LPSGIFQSLLGYGAERAGGFSGVLRAIILMALGTALVPAIRSSPDRRG
jgi:hypothetical protein